jgi:transglutaminase-like putative cysteine protease
VNTSEKVNRLCYADSKPPATVARLHITIEHSNRYRYTKPVEFTKHRLMLRPAEGHGLRIHAASLEISPAHTISWEHDVFYNSVAHVNFDAKATELVISSRYQLEQLNLNPFDFVMEIYANDLPFAYQDDDAADLAPYMAAQHPADEPAVRAWLAEFLDAHGRAKTLDLLLALNGAIAERFNYGRREAPGIQPPAETLKLGTGSCRDFALLLMEAARHLGLAARYVSGYLCSMQGSEAPPHVADNATHAWTEIYLPGAGWKGFDPTCGILAAGFHVRVAATRNPAQATPIRGSYLGDGSLFAGMDVAITASAQDPSQTQST